MGDLRSTGGLVEVNSVGFLQTSDTVYKVFFLSQGWTLDEEILLRFK